MNQRESLAQEMLVDSREFHHAAKERNILWSALFRSSSARQVMPRRALRPTRERRARVRSARDAVGVFRLPPPRQPVSVERADGRSEVTPRGSGSSIDYVLFYITYKPASVNRRAGGAGGDRAVVGCEDETQGITRARFGNRHDRYAYEAFRRDD